ncbi:hypothetical protein AMP9_3916 [plant metagenome]|uniref:Uncharacterized protein n=1 Tax=plant metagenome TaxID=1297885 RepID=A0A484P5K3_9ZZZZ
MALQRDLLGHHKCVPTYADALDDDQDQQRGARLRSVFLALQLA